MSVTEDYCSFETAKLLKEKGFDLHDSKELYIEYKDGYCVINNPYTKHYRTDEFPKATLQIVMKWLREIHNLSVEVYRTACGYIGCIVAIPSGTDIKFLEDDGDDLPSGQYTTFLKACEAAIKYCLTNLI